MFTDRRYPLRIAIPWTWDFIVGPAVLTTVVFACYHYLHFEWLVLPPTALAIVGTAVSFYLGFKGNTAYGRLWEARIIWGGIVNSSRTWGAFVRDYVTVHFTADSSVEHELDAIHRELVYRHVAWLGALRTLLRRPRTWETKARSARRFREEFGTDQMSDETLRSRMAGFVDDEELEWLMQRQNQATQLLAKQSERLRELHKLGLLDDFRHMALGGIIETLYTLQGQAERIKNFPLPRQYASANSWFVTLFVFAMPITLVPTFAEMEGPVVPWLAFPCCTLLAWIFLTWNKIIDWSENPFDELGNDIPVDALSRTIEIDLREMLGETELPPKLESHNSILL